MESGCPFTQLLEEDEIPSQKTGSLETCLSVLGIQGIRPAYKLPEGEIA
jgi:hypothetical protein